VVSGDQVAAFAVASFVLIVVPGPGVLFVVGRALAHGRAVALASVAGHAAGNWVVAVCVALGIGTIVERSAAVFTAIRLAGVLAAAAAPRSGGRAAREGFVVGVTNPKAVILFAAVLPQFVNRAAGHIPLQMLLLSVISIVIGLASDTCWGLAASTVRAWFARSPRRLSLIGGAGGLAIIGLGVTLAVTGRKD